MAQFSLDRPWAAEPWGSFEQLRREMDSLFNRFGGSAPRASMGRGIFPPVNLYETADAYILTAELPGMQSEDIRVSVEGSTVTLEGERRFDYLKEEKEAKEPRASLHRAERQAGRFRRAFELPARIESDKAEAIHRYGVLMLRLPKTPDAQAKQIAVQSS